MALSRMKEAFDLRVNEVVEELRPMLDTNYAFVKNNFPVRIGKIIKESNAELIAEERRNAQGKLYQHLRVQFKDGTITNLPTIRRLTAPPKPLVEENHYVIGLMTGIIGEEVVNATKSPEA